MFLGCIKQNIPSLDKYNPDKKHYSPRFLAATCYTSTYRGFFFTKIYIYGWQQVGSICTNVSINAKRLKFQKLKLHLVKSLYGDYKKNKVCFPKIFLSELPIVQNIVVSIRERRGIEIPQEKHIFCIGFCIMHIQDKVKIFSMQAKKSNSNNTIFNSVRFYINFYHNKKKLPHFFFTKIINIYMILLLQKGKYTIFTQGHSKKNCGN